MIGGNAPKCLGLKSLVSLAFSNDCDPPDILFFFNVFIYSIIRYFSSEQELSVFFFLFKHPTPNLFLWSLLTVPDRKDCILVGERVVLWFVFFCKKINQTYTLFHYFLLGRNSWVAGQALTVFPSVSTSAHESSSLHMYIQYQFFPLCYSMFTSH